MSFRDNLQHLRATRNMTQEQLAVLLGVSRQSVAKWEAERSYPEMDKLLRMCDLFDCALDDLVKGNLTSRPVEKASIVTPSAPQDTCGYDVHMRSVALRTASGVAAIILGVAVGVLAAEMTSLSVEPGALTLAAILLGVFVGLALIIPTSMSHSSFVKAHPFVEDFYSEDDKRRASQQLGWGIVGGIGWIFLGVLVAAFAPGLDGSLFTVTEGAAAGLLLVLIAMGVWDFIYFGMMHSRTKIENYNNDVMDEHELEELVRLCADPQMRQALEGSMGMSYEEILRKKRQDKKLATICGIIMLTATAVALIWLFIPISSGAVSEIFWLPWPIGGICCAIAAAVMSMRTGEK